MPTVLITGANRGLGREFTRQYAADGWTVHAACREPSSASALRAIAGRVQVHALDVADPQSIVALARELQGTTVDVLLNNAGIMEPRERHRIGHLDYAFWERAFRVNTFATAAMGQQFADHVAASDRKVMVSITSLLASIQVNQPGQHVPAGDATMYRTSKAALNMVVRCLAADLRPRGITAVAMSPGHVRTDMGAPDAPLSPEQSVGGLRKLIGSLTPAHSGRFFVLDGKALPWGARPRPCW